jgi:hypothetical protein
VFFTSYRLHEQSKFFFENLSSSYFDEASYSTALDIVPTVHIKLLMYQRVVVSLVVKDLEVV